MTRSVARRVDRLDSPRTTRVLAHHQQSRLARLELSRLNLSTAEVAARTGLHPRTVQRFCGEAGDENTRDPRTSTTQRVFEVLGWELVLRRAP